MGNLINLGVWPRGTLRPNGCLKPAEPFVFPSNDVQLTFDQSVALCWRVKRWKLDFEFQAQGDFSAPVPIPGTNPTEFEMQVTDTFTESASFQGELLVRNGLNNYTAREAHSGFFPPQPSPATIVQTITKELDLICAGNNSFFVATPNITTTAFYGSGGSDEFSGRISFSLSQMVDNTLKARLWMFNNGVIGSRVAFALVPEASGQLKGELRLLGNSIPLPFRATYNTGTQGVPPPTLSGPTVSYYETTLFRFILEPSAYWEYDPLDGKGPIYDEATGFRLRPNP